MPMVQTDRLGVCIRGIEYTRQAIVQEEGTKLQDEYEGAIAG